MRTISTLLAACFVIARHFSNLRHRDWRTYAVSSGVMVLGLISTLGNGWGHG